MFLCGVLTEGRALFDQAALDRGFELAFFLGAGNSGARNVPVWEAGFSATCSGVPVATI